MPSFSSLRNGARNISQKSNDPTVAKLADIIAQLCNECDDLEKKTKEARDEARRAFQAAKK